MVCVHDKDPWEVIVTLEEQGSTHRDQGHFRCCCYLDREIQSLFDYNAHDSTTSGHECAGVWNDSFWNSVGLQRLADRQKMYHIEFL